jgi:hypothetical protein
MTIILVFFVWYPEPLDKAIGVKEIFLILLTVDIIIGPLMTLVVYKPGKPGLILDLSIIAALQIAALIYGMSTVFAGRPVFIVFNQSRFDIVRPIEIDSASAKKAELAGNDTAKIGWFSPRWIGAVAPTDRKHAEEIMFAALGGGPDWPQLPELYVPIEQVKQQILQKARPLSELRKMDKNKVLVGVQDNFIKWLPLRGKTQDMAVLINGNTSEIIKVVAVNPWPGN